jgi:ABC transporter substrate binding protein
MTRVLSLGHTDTGPPRRAARRRGRDPVGPCRPSGTRRRASLLRDRIQSEAWPSGAGLSRRCLRGVGGPGVARGFPGCTGGRPSVHEPARRGHPCRRSVLARVARAAAPRVPIVFITPGDPVAAGLVASLARPGGNMTAMTFEYPELSGKRLELLTEIVPRARRVLMLNDPRDASPRQGAAAAREAAAKLHLILVEREVRNEGEVIRALTELEQVDALLEVPGGAPSSHYAAMIRAANAKRRPTILHARTGSTQDALITYGVNDADIAREVARLVDKVLKGANAGDLPVERPTKVALDPRRPYPGPGSAARPRRQAGDGDHPHRVRSPLWGPRAGRIGRESRARGRECHGHLCLPFTRSALSTLTFGRPDR